MIGKSYGYARASSEDQDCALQEARLREAGCDIVRSEKRTGTTLAGRDELATLMEFMREGDTLVVTRVDRLARSLSDLLTIVNTLEARRVKLRSTDQPVDTSSPAGRAFLQMLGVFAEFETALRRERQMEGIAKAKSEGRYQGRRPSVPVEEVKALAAKGMGATAIAKQLGIARSSVYAALE
ncbi:MAG: recombinase family protein [Hyphomonadaceae bacterium]